MASENDEPTVPVHCEACETTNRVALSDVAASVERHNERVHDGEEIATVDPDVADRLADLVAADLGLLEE
ncbi:hypothetical protein EFA46_011495 (plasmid) [Halarchaeum sp. CBA1220]|uniref:DUF8149 domain-containing protein n=1 Tax=Halarchaeum grantii TaxID=1193105 RepID=A0A830FE88_9EURY|nr:MULTISPECIES: hypothetical protein [Halarchaeum]QLC34879.1 hypothetical protein EFA46_011495 [Halarchaeum sp. CBA1220]GGL38030.1 hypothetical protein GCM10009037_21990 [Halarchaeum grantii]